MQPLPDIEPLHHPKIVTRVNVGCGPNDIKRDWWNVDIRGFPGVDEVMDASQPWRYTNCLSYVYAEHFLEHLSALEAIRFLTHAGNALRIGGRIRLSTPSLEWVLLSHFARTETDVEKRIKQTLRINRAFYGWGHKLLYSQELLRCMLEQLGFVDLGFFSYGQSLDPELQEIEQHGGYTVIGDTPSVWIVEATKGLADIAPTEQLVTLLTAELVRHVQGGH